MKKRKKKPIQVEGKAYQALLADIKGLIEDAKAKGVPLFERDDLLTCRNCGAYEDVLCNDDKPRRVYLKSGVETDREFIVIDSKSAQEKKERGFTSPCPIVSSAVFAAPIKPSIFSRILNIRSASYHPIVASMQGSGTNGRDRVC